MTEQELYEMKLHEMEHLTDFADVMRVIGGWNYLYYSLSEIPELIAIVFVPEQSKLAYLPPTPQQQVEGYAKYINQQLNK